MGLGLTTKRQATAAGTGANLRRKQVDHRKASHEGTRDQFNGRPGVIKLGIDVHQDFYVVELEAEGRSLMVNHGIEPVKNWWKPRTFVWLPVPECMKELLQNSQPILLALQERIGLLTLQLQSAADPAPPRGLGLMSSVVIDREIVNLARSASIRLVLFVVFTTTFEHARS